MAGGAPVRSGSCSGLLSGVPVVRRFVRRSAPVGALVRRFVCSGPLRPFFAPVRAERSTTLSVPDFGQTWCNASCGHNITYQRLSGFDSLTRPTFQKAAPVQDRSTVTGAADYTGTPAANSPLFEAVRILLSQLRGQ